MEHLLCVSEPQSHCLDAILVTKLCITQILSAETYFKWTFKRLLKRDKDTEITLKPIRRKLAHHALAKIKIIHNKTNTITITQGKGRKQQTEYHEPYINPELISCTPLSSTAQKITTTKKGTNTNIPINQCKFSEDNIQQANKITTFDNSIEH